MSCLHPVRTCFSVTCPHLDENDGKPYLTTVFLLQIDIGPSKTMDPLAVTHASRSQFFATKLSQSLFFASVRNSPSLFAFNKTSEKLYC